LAADVSGSSKLLYMAGIPLTPPLAGAEWVYGLCSAGDIRLAPAAPAAAAGGDIRLPGVRAEPTGGGGLDGVLRTDEDWSASAGAAAGAEVKSVARSLSGFLLACGAAGGGAGVAAESSTRQKELGNQPTFPWSEPAHQPPASRSSMTSMRSSFENVR
jgi:hypothetical protein